MKACAGAATAREMVVVAVRLPETPVIVIVDVPVVDAQLDVSVSTLLPVVGLVPNAAVIPLGRPDAARVTLPVKPPTSVTAIVSVRLLPGATVSEAAEGLSVKLPAPVTVRVIAVVAVRLPEVPVIVTVDVPSAAVLLVVNVTTLEVEDEAGLKDAVTPPGNPEVVKATAPENGLTSVTVIVSVLLLLSPTDVEAIEGFSVKLPFAAPHVTPFTANDVGIALVPLHVPLNPTPL
jgi:hypothetical protein